MKGPNHKNGFTLIELVVVMAVFLVIIGTALVIFISIVQHQRRIFAQQKLLSQASYAVEFMSKGLRMAKRAGEEDSACGISLGYIYQLEDYSGGEWRGIRFINQSDNNACQKFCLDLIDQNNPESGYVLKEIKGFPSSWSCQDNPNAVPVTSASLKIDSLSFSVNGAGPGDPNYNGASNQEQIQPRVTISMAITVMEGGNQPETKVQTTVSERNLNKND